MCKNFPQGVLVLKTWRGREHHESPGETIGEWTVNCLSWSRSPRVEGSNWGLAPRGRARALKKAQERLLVKGQPRHNGDSSILEMSIPWKDHWGHQQWWGRAVLGLKINELSAKQMAEVGRWCPSEPRGSWVGPSFLHCWVNFDFSLFRIKLCPWIVPLWVRKCLTFFILLEPRLRDWKFWDISYLRETISF